jgi:hypothetical protein
LQIHGTESEVQRAAWNWLGQVWWRDLLSTTLRNLWHGESRPKQEGESLQFSLHCSAAPTMSVSVTIAIVAGVDIPNPPERVVSLHSWLTNIRKITLAKFGPLFAKSSAPLGIETFPVPAINIVSTNVPSVAELLVEIVMYTSLARTLVSGEEMVWCQAIFLVVAFAANLNYTDTQINGMITDFKQAPKANEIMNTFLQNESTNAFGAVSKLKAVLGWWTAATLTVDGFKTDNAQSIKGMFA